jgi:hypothetical protein
MQFIVNEAFLAKARTVLADRRRVYWIVGGSCSGKSTLCRNLSAAYDIPVYDMDAQIFGGYQGRYVPERHPASLAWFGAGDPLAWALALSLDDWYHLNRATHAEYLDLLADDLLAGDPSGALLIDGGITNPALLAQVMPVSQIAGLALPPLLSARIWEEDEARREMKEMIQRLPDPQQTWDAFLAKDEFIHRTIVEECQACGIQLFWRDENTAPDALAQAVWQFLGAGEVQLLLRS